MAILISDEIRDALERELQYAENSVQIISAFCKERTIERLNSLIPEGVSDRNIMLRFRMDDIVKGVTDIEAARLCIDEGWNVYFRFDLHAKTYIVDDKRGIIGSANSTNKGLSFSKASNLEIATLVDMDDVRPEDRLRDVFRRERLPAASGTRVPGRHHLPLQPEQPDRRRL